MDYQLLETFIVISEVRNITKCSRLLYKTQPTITKRLQQLESEVGYSLIVREKGKQEISLTPRGKLFLQNARELYNLYNKLSLSTEETGNSLFISSIASFQTPLVTDVCKQMNKVSGTNSCIYTYQTEDVYQKIADKKLDLAIVSESANIPGVVCEQLFTQRYFIAKYSEQPIRDISMISADDLDITNEIYQQWDKSFIYWHNRVFHGQKGPMMTDSPATTKELLRGSSYWTFFQECTAYAINQEISLQFYEIKDPPPLRRCYMLTNRFTDKKIQPLITQFKDLLLQNIKKYKIK